MKRPEDILNQDSLIQENTEDCKPNNQDAIEEIGVKHYPYTADFINAEDEDVRVTFHFRKPQRQHILRIASAGKDKAYDSQLNILVELVLKDERVSLRELFNQYPLVVTSFGDAVFKAAGAGSVFKGK